MKAKSLLVLIAVAVGAVLAAVWLKRPQEQPLALIGQDLMPELKQNINQVNGLQVTRAGNQTVADIQRGEQGWVVRNKDNYPADMGRVRETLLLLANARLLEEKTADPQYYNRLGVQDVASPDASGAQLTLEGLNAPFNLIIGKAAAGAGGVYVRRPGDVRSFQIDTRLAVPTTVKDWLERSVLDIPAGRIQAINIRQPDGQTLTLEKGARDQANFKVLNIPAGQSLKADTVANPLANGLAGLGLDDVFPVGAVKPTNDRITEAVYRTFDGLVITARLFQVDNKRYAQFKADFDEAQAGRFAQGSAGAKATGAPAVGSATAQSAARDEAKRLSERLSPWVYVISAYKYDTLAKRMDHLLKSTQPEAEETVTAPGPQGQPKATDAPATEDNAAVEEGEEAMPAESDEGEEMAPSDEEAAPDDEAMPNEETTPDDEAMPSEEEPAPEEDMGGAEEQPEEAMPPDEAQPPEEEVAPEEENDAR